MPQLSGHIRTTNSPGAGAFLLGFNGDSVLGIQIAGTWVGTIEFEVSLDGVHYSPLLVRPVGLSSSVDSTTTNGLWSAQVGGFGQVRIRFSAYTSGQAIVTVLSGDGVAAALAAQAGGGGGGGTSSAFGSAFPADGTAAGFLDPDGNMAAAKVTADGKLQVDASFSGGVVDQGAAGVDPWLVTGDELIATADVLGTQTDAAVIGDDDGTISAKLRGISEILADVWDSVGNRFNVLITNTTLAVTQSGAWSVVLAAGSAIIGKVGIDQTTPGTTNGVVVNNTVTVTGPLTDTQLRATPVPVSGTVGVTGVATAANQATEIASLASIDGKTPALGQALAAASTPVVLPAAQITTLTPPAAITNYALEAGGHLATVDTSTAATAGVAGITTGAKVITDANGTLQQYLRGLVYLLATAGQAFVTAALSAGTNLIGKVAGAQSYDIIYNGTTPCTVKFAKIVASSSGPTELVAAVTSKRIVVVDIVLMANGTVNVKFQSHVTPTDITGLLYLVANTGFAPGFDPTGHFQTVAGEALDINLSASIAVGGWLKYIEV